MALEIFSGRVYDARMISTASRFWSKVNKGGPMPDYAPQLGPCWLWTGAMDEGGYGQFGDGKAQFRAHRVAYEMSGKVIPDGLGLDHLCRVRNCVNPTHLEPVTNLENIRRGAASRAGVTTGTALREWMTARRWGIHALAGELGIHPSTLQRYRTGELAIPKVVELALRAIEAR